jgi:hypothetical protein
VLGVLVLVVLELGVLVLAGARLIDSN